MGRARSRNEGGTRYQQKTERHAQEIRPRTTASSNGNLATTSRSLHRLYLDVPMRTSFAQGKAQVRPRSRRRRWLRGGAWEAPGSLQQRAEDGECAEGVAYD